MFKNWKFTLLNFELDTLLFSKKKYLVTKMVGFYLKKKNRSLYFQKSLIIVQQITRIFKHTYMKIPKIKLDKIINEKRVECVGWITLYKYIVYIILQLHFGIIYNIYFPTILFKRVFH